MVSFMSLLTVWEYRRENVDMNVYHGARRMSEVTGVLDGHN